jgi:hypothetical protein
MLPLIKRLDPSRLHIPKLVAPRTSTRRRQGIAEAARDRARRFPYKATSRRQSRRGTAEGHLRSFTAALRRTPVHTRTSSVPTSQPAEEAYRYNELLALVSNDRPARGHERHHPPTDRHCRRRHRRWCPRRRRHIRHHHHHTTTQLMTTTKLSKAKPADSEGGPTTPLLCSR